MSILTPTFNDNPRVIRSKVRYKVRESTEKRTKVAILGTAPSSRQLAPYDDDEWDIWACSPGNMGALPRVDRWFELHSSLHWAESDDSRQYLEFLRNLEIPVYAQDVYACPDGELPNATVYPKEEMVKKFGPYFFTSSFAWMLALAIHEEFKEIGFFGVDMSSKDEYILQRPGAYYFIMEAIKLGIKVGAPKESDILQPPPLYGYMESSNLYRKIIVRENEINSRMRQMRAERDRLNINIAFLEGALDDSDYYKVIWSGTQE